jgi:cytochrome c oxidase subunit 1
MATHAPAPAHAPGGGHGGHETHQDPRPVSYWWIRAAYGTVGAILFSFLLVFLLRAGFGFEPLWDGEVYAAVAGLLGGIGFLWGIGCFDFWLYWAKGGDISHEDHSFHGVTNWKQYFRINTDHKVIGVQYLAMTFFFMLWGGLMALLIRTELAAPGQQIADGQTYNGFLSMHATLMIFVFAVPVFGGLANYVLPIMLGAKDMAFPRLNALSFWFLPVAGFMFLASMFTGMFASAWTAYPPLASQGTVGQTLFALGVQFAGASSIATAINFLATIITMRAPGMTIWRMPILAWATGVTSVLAVFATPFVAGSQFLTLFDRVMGTNFFVPDQGGDVIMYQHIFWFYSHPAVYIMLLPGLGIISEVIATFARKPLFGYRAMAFSLVAIAVLGFGVWAHHMFVSGMASWLRVPMMITTIIIAVPTGVKVWSWLATLWEGKIHMKTPMLWALGFLFTFVMGGLSGVFLGVVPADIQVSDTYFVTAHLHYVLYGGSVYTVFAAVYYWFPKMTGKMYNERLGQWHFWLTFIGTQLTFLPMHWQGLQGMPRRVSDYDPRFEMVNSIETVGSYILGVATIIFFYNVVVSWKSGPKAPWNPWRGKTLEWMVSSPPPLFNFDVVPQVVGGPYQYGIPDARHAVVFAPEEFGGELKEDTRYPVLVVANETLTSQTLIDEIRSRDSEGLWSFELVVPLEGGDRVVAERRLATALAILAEYGVSATGRLAEGDVVDVATQAAAAGHPNELVMATLPLRESAWMRSDAVDKVRKATGVAMSHVVVPGDDARAISAASALPLVMVVATEAVGAEALATAVRTRADAEPARFAVIAPLDLPEPRWGAEATELRRQAGEAMTATINALVDTGVAVEGQVMDDGPATALPLVIQAYRPARIVVAGVNGEARGLAEAATAAAGDIPVDTVNLGATAGA